MNEILEFKNKEVFRSWLIENHDTEKGHDIFVYKKGFEKFGLTYEEAVTTALCYGWIDSVTHRYNEQKFIQYFAPRRKSSNWSLSNIKRMAILIDNNEMTEYGLRYFDVKILDNLEQMIEEDKLSKTKPVDIPKFFYDILVNNQSLNLFLNETKSSQRRYLYYIMDAKKDETKIRRCKKVISILNGGTNNL